MSKRRIGGWRSGTRGTRNACSAPALNTECKLLLLTHAFEKLHCIAVEFRTHFMNSPVARGNRAARREAGRHPAQSPARDGRRVSRHRRVHDHRIGNGRPCKRASQLPARKAETRAMLIDFFYSSARREAADFGEGIPDAARSAEGARDRAVARRFLLPRAHCARQGREALRQVRPGVRRVLQRRGDSRRSRVDIPLDWLQEAYRARFHARGEGSRSKRSAASTS